MQYKLLIDNYLKATEIAKEKKLNDKQLAEVMIDVNLAKHQSLFQYFDTQKFRIIHLDKQLSSCVRSIALAVYGD